MTGEVTLQGRVLSVGGLKEKLLAAIQHDIKTVLLPHENYDDIQEMLKDTKLDDLKLVFVRNMDEVIKAAFKAGTFKKIEKKSKIAITRKRTK